MSVVPLYEGSVHVAVALSVHMLGPKIRTLRVAKAQTQMLHTPGF